VIQVGGLSLFVATNHIAIVIHHIIPATVAAGSLGPVVARGPKTTQAFHVPNLIGRTVGIAHAVVGFAVNM